MYDANTGLVKFRNCCWFTNIDHCRRHEPLMLMTMADNIKFSRHKEIKDIGYPHYDNYDAIEVPFTDAIPSDYNGVMGVPISFMDKYCHCRSLISILPLWFVSCVSVKILPFMRLFSTLYSGFSVSKRVGCQSVLYFLLSMA